MSRKKQRRKRRGLRAFIKSFTLTLLIFMIIGGAWLVREIIASAPDVDLMHLEPNRFATVIYDDQGNEVQKLVASGANREAAAYDELPEDLINAFVAIEDARFWKHNGIDLRSIARAAVGVITRDYSGGGSTITQQLIKNNVFSGGMEPTWGQKIVRKIQEQYVAVRLERNSGMDKQETKRYIMTNYLNTINLGSNALGVKVAARRYFGKEVSQLTLSECTVLAPIVQSPTRLNPITGREANEKRREIVLKNMVDQGYITEDERREALEDPVYDRIQDVDAVIQDKSEAYSYFTDELIGQVTEQLVSDLGYTEEEARNLLYSSGLQIYSTQNSAIQGIVDQEVNNPEHYDTTKYSVEYRLSIREPGGELVHYSEEGLLAYRKEVLGDAGFNGLYLTEEEARDDIAKYREWLLTKGGEAEGERSELILQPQTSVVIMDHHTGAVKAISGGRGEKTGNLTLNRATDVPRQPGSAFKVLTSFGPALDRDGATLGTVYYDAPYGVNGKSFRNWWGDSRGYTGYAGIRDGIMYSMNIIAVRTMMETVTPRLGIEYARNMGITTLTEDDMYASAALGGLTYGVSNLELTAAYASIANQGVYTKPQFFTKVLDREGNVLIDNTPETKTVLKDTTAFLLTDAMAESTKSRRLFTRGDISIKSTNSRAALEGMSTAGKSGTTTNNVDIWFVGYTPYYTAGIWGGCDDYQPLSSGNMDNGGTGYRWNVWKAIMSRVHEGLSDPGFERPASIETASICRKSGKLPVPGVCDADPRGTAVYTEYFAPGTVPSQTCDKHQTAAVCTVSGMAATEYCPESKAGVYMKVPEQEDGITDDSMLAPPGTCTIHTQAPVEETIDELAPPLNIGPGQVPGGYGPGGGPDIYGPGIDPGIVPGEFGPGYWPGN